MRIPPWIGTNKLWTVNVHSQVVDRKSNPPESGLLVRGGENGSYIDSLFLEYTGATGGSFVVYLFCRPSETSVNFFLLGSKEIGSASEPGLGVSIPRVDLTDILPAILWSPSKTSTSHQGFHLAQGACLYIGVDRSPTKPVVVSAGGGDVIITNYVLATGNSIQITSTTGVRPVSKVGSHVVAITGVGFNASGLKPVKVGSHSLVTDYNPTASGLKDVGNIGSHTVGVATDQSATASGIKAVDNLGSHVISIGGYEPEASLLFGAFSGSYTNDDRDAINQVFISLKLGATSGTNILAKLDWLFFACAPIEADALINWCNPGTWNLSKVGTVTFTSNEGWTGNTTAGNYLTPNGYIPSSSSKFLQNSGCIFVYSRTQSQANFEELGSASAGDANYTGLQLRNTNNQLGGNVNSSSGRIASSVGAVTDSRGLFLSNRTASNALEHVRNTSVIVSSTNASTGRSNVQVNIGGYRSGTSNLGGTARQTSCHGWGGGLTTAERTDLYNAIQVYMTYKAINV